MKVNETEVKVRYQETDQMGVVYHANYLVWFEIGRTAFIEDLGFYYHDMEESGIVSPLVDANIQFKKPLRYGQTATVKTWLDYYDGLKVIYAYEIQTPEGEAAVMGKTQHVCVKKENFRPVSIRRVFPEWHKAYLAAKGDA
ncbi:YbgC/FadM family acyl-CoA thioesterase [Pontibacillus yanchengensis]|uniref:YbgC/FadM family acyl-CoA thioesterase n=2 Tax=Pontibacillus yanchengensis TaxID=462910 RepID=A0ACC7VB19_9BACI|nr:thioesterase family protein [Pontibacillus yanchengensis]MYL33276.1 YbgC/FadM family acyl-CoA thioesterase [Pontibacillus yanchengensis]MYL51888.1 YbgC/FadM family acyl-CoA thioesterase [Pontibacillus yanchengensis]